MNSCNGDVKKHKSSVSQKPKNLNLAFDLKPKNLNLAFDLKPKNLNFPCFFQNWFKPVIQFYVTLFI